MFFMSSGGGRGPTDDFWFEPVGTPTAAGSRVSPDTALLLPAVYQCVRILAETVGHLPLHLYRRLPNGGAERAVGHPLYPVLYRRPNRWQTGLEWREMMQGHLGLRGNAYSEMVFKPNGQVRELVPLHPDRTRIELLNERRRYRYVYNDPELGRERRIPADRMLHLRGLSSDGYFGLNPIEVQRETLGYAQAAQEHGARFYSNGAVMPGWIEYPSQFRDRDQRREFRRNWQEQQTGANKYKTPVLEFGMKYHQLEINHADLEYLETVKHKDLDIARMFNMPPGKLGIEVKNTYANREQDSLDFVIGTMLPWLRRWEERLTEDLLLESEQEEYFLRFNVAALLRGDSKARADYYHQGISDGWLTRNEARDAEERNPLPGLDQPLQPLNMEPVGSGGEKQSNRAALVMERAAERVVRKEIAAVRDQYTKTLKGKADADGFGQWAADWYADHAAFVAEVLAVGHDAALAYCVEAAAEVQAAIAAEREQSEPCVPALLERWEAEKAAQLVNLGEEQ